MKLGSKVLEELRLARDPQKENGRVRGLEKNGTSYEMKLEVDDLHLRLVLQDFDKYSFLLQSIELRDARPSKSKVAASELVRRQAAQLEGRITYLLESFRLIELDETKAIGQIRSVTPYQNDKALQYYEIVLEKGKTLRFERFMANKGESRRTHQTCHFDDQTLERLLDDLGTAIREP